MLRELPPGLLPLLNRGDVERDRPEFIFPRPSKPCDRPMALPGPPTPERFMELGALRGTTFPLSASRLTIDRALLVCSDLKPLARTLLPFARTSGTALLCELDAFTLVSRPRLSRT